MVYIPFYVTHCVDWVMVLVLSFGCLNVVLGVSKTLDARFEARVMLISFRFCQLQIT